jgi:hypothetical protein
MKPTISCQLDQETDRTVKLFCQENGRISEAAFLRQAIAEKLARWKAGK